MEERALSPPPPRRSVSGELFIFALIPFFLAREQMLEGVAATDKCLTAHTWLAYSCQALLGCDVQRMYCLAAQALDTLAGLHSERLGSGGFRFTHRGTGYSFEIRPAETDSAAQDEALVPGQQDLAFIPVALGQAAQVRQSLVHSRTSCAFSGDPQQCQRRDLETSPIQVDLCQLLLHSYKCESCIVHSHHATGGLLLECRCCQDT